jgi:hypothetical protein
MCSRCRGTGCLSAQFSLSIHSRWASFGWVTEDEDEEEDEDEIGGEVGHVHGHGTAMALFKTARTYAIH